MPKMPDIKVPDVKMPEVGHQVKGTVPTCSSHRRGFCHSRRCQAAACHARAVGCQNECGHAQVKVPAPKAKPPEEKKEVER